MRTTGEVSRNGGEERRTDESIVWSKSDGETARQAGGRAVSIISLALGVWIVVVLHIAVIIP